MATTITRTAKENGSGSSYQSTWTFTITGVDIIATGNTFDYTSPTLTAKYVGSSKGYAAAQGETGDVKIGGKKVSSISKAFYNTITGSNLQSWSSGTTKTVTKRKYDNTGAHTATLNTATYFNSSNPTIKTLNITFSGTSHLVGESASNASSTSHYNFATGERDWGTLATLTLDAPPILDNATLTSSTRTYFWKGYSSAKVTLSQSWIQYGGTISSATLTIGEQTVTGSTGTLKIIPDTVGTFTPTLTVIDSRGQTTTKTFDPIVVQEYSSPTASWGTIQSDTTGYWVDKTYASITVGNFNQSQGFKPERIRLIIGEQVQTVELTGNETSVPLSIKVNTAGSFIPQVRVLFSSGLETYKNYTEITVQTYASPNIEVEINRATTINSDNTTKRGILSDDGEEILISLNVTYKDECGGLLQPEVTITDNIPNTGDAIVTWYETWSESNGVSNPINWTNYNPTSPKKIYGLATGYGNISTFNPNYSFNMTITPIDAIGRGRSITTIISSAFYTVDFLAGGHGIAFGQPAAQEGFECNMPTIFHDTVDCEDGLTTTTLEASQGITVIDTIDFTSSDRLSSASIGLLNNNLLQLPDITTFDIEVVGSINVTDTSGKIVVPNNSAYMAKTSNGDERRLCYISTANNYIYGYDSYQNGEGGSYLYGNTLGIRSKGNISIGIAADNNTIYMNGVTYPSSNIVMPNNVSIRAKTANGNNNYSLIYASDSNNIVVGNSSWNDCYIHRVYSSDTGTVSTVPNVRILDNNRLTRTTHANSSIKIKHDIKNIENKELDPHRLYGVEIKQFVYNDDVITDKNDCRYHKEIAGFIAEQLHECYPIAVDINEKGECEAWQAQYIIPPMLKLIQEQHEEIEQLKKEVAELKNK